PMAQTQSSRTGAPLVTSIAFSRARGPPTCRCRRPPSTIWLSTSRRPRRSASICRRRCSPAPRAQDLTVPLIGLLNSASPGPFARLVDAFRQGLREGGYVEGRNVRIEYRWAEGQFARLPELAADLVHRRVSLIVA